MSVINVLSLDASVLFNHIMIGNKFEELVHKNIVTPATSVQKNSNFFDESCVP